MVEKIDRPDAPHPYQISRAKDAKEDQHRPPSEREEQERRYQKELAEKEWGKFDSRSITIKPLRVARESVERCLFRSISLNKGIGTLQVDVVWKDGRTTKGALVLVPKLDKFLQLKKLSLGQEVPDQFWSKEQIVEFGIIQIVSQSTGFPRSKRPEEITATARTKTGLLDNLNLVDLSGKINWNTAGLYLFLLFFVILIAVLLIR